MAIYNEGEIVCILFLGQPHLAGELFLQIINVNGELCFIPFFIEADPVPVVILDYFWTISEDIGTNIDHEFLTEKVKTYVDQYTRLWVEVANYWASTQKVLSLI